MLGASAQPKPQAGNLGFNYAARSDPRTVEFKKKHEEAVKRIVRPENLVTQR